MALMKCGECGGKVSSKAKRCPHCGVKIRAKMSMWAQLASLAIIIFLAWTIIFLLGGIESNDSRSIDSAEPIQVVFDIPKLLTMDIEQVKNELGEPTSEWLPSEFQISWDPEIPATATYTRGTTTIQIDYYNSGSIPLIFIVDSTEGRKGYEIAQLGNLNPESTGYSLRVVDWAKPKLAKQRKRAEIAGIEVKLK